MMLSPLKLDQLDRIIDCIDRALEVCVDARHAFRKIADTRHLSLSLRPYLHAGHSSAVDLARSLGMATFDEAPGNYYSWDGRAVCTQTETSVLLHEIAHWQIANKARRRLPDFGLGPGPETGYIAEANAARCVDDFSKEREEDLASLLGILWEVEFGGSALRSFCEQNWLELYDRPVTISHFVSVFQELRERSLITAGGRPNVQSNAYVSGSKRKDKC